MSFVTEKPIKAVRKRHLCCACDKWIEAGEPAINWAGNTDGDFQSGYYHHECRTAEIAYNHECLDNRFSDEWASLNEADSDDYRWIKANHPIAYRRMLTPRASTASGHTEVTAPTPDAA